MDDEQERHPEPQRFWFVAGPGARSWLPLPCFENPERKPRPAPAGTLRRPQVSVRGWSGVAFCARVVDCP
jgi:hypothetical protein